MAGIFALLALIAVYVALKESGTLGTILDAAALRERIERLGAWGPLAIIALMMLAILVSPIPSAPIAMAAGAAYGHAWGTLYVVTGAEAGALAAFGIARILGQDVLYRWFGGRLSAGLIGSQNALTWIVFISRLLPFVSFDLVSYAAGLTLLSVWRFALATLAGIVPASFLLAHLGLEMADGEADRFMYSALALGLITAIPIALKLARDRRGRRATTMASALREGFACRLCWRITFAVFVLILVAESVLLVPSAVRFERLELDRMAQRAEGWIEPLLTRGRADWDRNALEGDLAALIGAYEIDAVAIYRADGSLAVAVGQAPPPARSDGADGSERMPRVTTRSEDGSKINVAWRSRSSGAPTAVARLDTSQVRNDLIAYLMRIGGLVAVIVLVVTVGTMYVLDRWVLRAVLRLRESAVKAASEPGRADQFAVPTRRNDELGELIGAHNSMLVQVAESKRRDIEVAEERARYLARHQPLTGLPNRQALIEYIDLLGTQRGDDRRCVSLLLLNLAQFRLLNTSIGVERCDELLRQMATRLRRAARSRDFVAHLGADRFTVVHDGAQCGGADAAEIAQTLLRELGAHYELGGADIASLTLRIGIGQSADRAIDGRTLLNEAELALARTADVDGAKYLFFSPDLAAQARDRQRLARDLERAIQRGELFPVLQPKWALQAEGGVRLAGAEALVRWRDPERGLVRPDQFIPVAESTGLIEPIGDFMLRSACRTMRDWSDRFGWSPGIAVNLTAHQFADAALPQRLKRALDETGVAAGLLEVEITESAAMKDVARSTAALQALRDLGVRVSIDDFGTGYSSLSYLRRFAVDAIKIDKSFVDDIGSDRNADAICDAILRLGQSLGTKVIAEGVETEVQMAFLRQRRCDEVQGYLLGKPVPVGEFEQIYLTRPLDPQTKG